MKKIKLKNLKKRIDNFLKKIKVYLFYIQRFPQAIIKAPVFFITYGPKKFFWKMKTIENKLSPVIHYKSYIIDLILIFFNPSFYLKGIKILFTQGPIALLKKTKLNINEKNHLFNINQQYQLWFKKNYPSSSQLSKQSQLSKLFKYQPKISIITPVYNPEKKYLIECIESVLNQSYPNWELCLVDDNSSKKYVKEILLSYQKKDKRIKVKFRKKNGHICRASNDALTLATGEYIALLDHDDFLWPNALYEVVKLINEKPHTQFIYSDEDKLDYDGKTHVDPFFKPDWSPDYLRSINYITHLAVLKKTLVDKIGGFRIGTEGAQDWDLFLRATYWLEKNIGHCHPLDKKNPIQHIPTVLYSWRKTTQSTASEKNIGKVKNYAYVNQKKVLLADLKRRGYQGSVEKTNYPGLWRLRYKIKDNPLVSIIIPTKNQYKYIKNCLNSILKKTTYKNYELIVVDTGSTEKDVWMLYQQIEKRYQSEKKDQPSFHLLYWKKPFNFSSVCNFGAIHSRGEYLIFLNNDTEIITPDWIEGMIEYSQRKEIGLVGCKLLFPNNTIQHAGVILGIQGDPTGKPIAGHAFKNYLDADQSEFFQAIHSIKNYSAVTFACAMVKKKYFFKLGALDENFRIAYNDVDFCLRVLNQKKFIVYQPYSELYHYESISVGRVELKNRDLNLLNKENKIMVKKWNYLLENDPYLNKNYSRKNENLGLDI